MFGGMFDPPHLGHLIVAQEARWQLRLDEVHLVVCARPAHRTAGVASAGQRLAMVQAAAASRAGIVASRIELDRTGPSFTVDTLTELAVSAPDTERWLIIGADQMLGLPRWREPERIIELARLGVVARDTSDLDAVAEAAEALAPGRVDLVAMPAVGLSSTLIRARIAAGEPVDHLLPSGVGEVIRREGLYGAGSALP